MFEIAASIFEDGPSIFATLPAAVPITDIPGRFAANAPTEEIAASKTRRRAFSFWHVQPNPGFSIAFLQYGHKPPKANIALAASLSDATLARLVSATEKPGLIVFRVVETAADGMSR